MDHRQPILWVLQVLGALVGLIIGILTLFGVLRR
jgi:hypothetical protein